MSENRSYGIAFAVSIVVAFLGSKAPSYQMPLDYGAIVSMSIPFAIAWALIVVFAVWRYNLRGLWLLAGAPLALYWPVWLMFNHFPACYYSHTCV